MKKTTWFAALCAAMLVLLAAGCNNGFNDAAVAAVAASQRPGTGSSHIPSMPDGEIDDDGVLTKYTGSETAVVIPDGVTGIGDGAFYGCESLVSVEIPDGVTGIGYGVFYGCTNLASVTIPASVTSIRWSAFYGCTKLKEIQFNGTKAQWQQAIEESSWVNVTCVFCTDGYLGVKEVPAYLIMVGTGVTGYADGLPANLVIPDGVTGIAWKSFYGCTSLVSVTIPASVTDIAWESFYGCTSLESVAYDGTLAQWCAMDNDNCLMSYAKHVTVEGKDLKQADSIAIPGGVTRIGENAFYDCESLKSVTIPDGVTSIGQYAFSGCTSLESVTIPASVTSIMWSAFNECTSLASVTYGGTLAQWCAMDGVENLIYYVKHVTVEGKDLKQAESIEIPDGVTSIGESAFSGCTSLVSVTIPGSVTSIGYEAFSGCTSLESVTIGNGVESIGVYAFRECTSLESVTIPGSVTSIGYEAFDGCAKLKVIHFNGTMAQWNAIQGVYNVKIPGISCTDGYLGIKDIPGCLTMSGTTVTGYSGEVPAEIVIPDGVTEIGWSAFEGCTALTDITIPDSVTSIGGSAFKGCTSLASVTIPDGVTEIGWSTFEGCTSLASVTIPDSVTEIGWSAFEGCTSLTDVTIPDGVTEIGRYAFKGCTVLTDITIPDRVTSIGYWAFIDCTNLTSVTYGGTKDGWGDIEKDSDIFLYTKVTEITDKDGVTFTVDRDGNITG